jgi:peptidoglycan hydrolase CwlO-like protein
MKHYFLLFSLLSFLLLPQSGQSQVYQSDENMSQGTNPALVVEIEVQNSKLVEKVWKDFMKSYGGKTKKAKRGEWLTTGADIVGVNGVNPMNIYAKTSSGSDGHVQHTVWFDRGDSYLESDQKREYDEAEKMLLTFAQECKIENTNQELSAAEKKLRSLENDAGRLKRQNNSYQKEIEQAEKRIEQAKENIAKNEEQQIDAADRITLQKELLEEIKQRLKDLKNN